MLTRARAQAIKGGWSPDKEWTIREEFLARDSQAYKEIQKFFKRVRKETALPPSALRYVCITEAHENGLPHYHVLVHEKFYRQNVRHRCLNDQWHLGFSNFKLLRDERQALYLAKYLSKDTTARIRPSAKYGSVDGVAGAAGTPKRATF